MAKITYVDTRLKADRYSKPVRISFKRLGEIFNRPPEEIEKEIKEARGNMWEYYIPFAEGIKCPFGERDLMDDTCYFGTEVHRCKYFRRYVHEGEHAGTIECCCPKDPIYAKKGTPIQLSLFDF